jgi:hypothetical protein
MQVFNIPKKNFNPQSHAQFLKPLQKIFPDTPQLKSQGHRPLKMTFEDQLNALIFFHLQEHESARDLIQHLKEDDFAKECIAPSGGISRSSFSEIINHRGLEQLEYVFQALCNQAKNALPSNHSDLGELISIDGSLIDAVLSMYWADYRKGAKKAKGHFGFDINHKIPIKIHLTDGNGGERPFVRSILTKGQTGIMDRGYQSHKAFDILQDENKHFVCRIKANTTRTIIKKQPVDPDSYIFYDAVVLLGTPGANQTKNPVRLIGYKIASVKYFVATDRHDLTADQIAIIYKLRWDIETFFKWWKKHLKVYHLIAHSRYGLMVQILAGLITYLLMSIYCREQFNEPVSVNRIRQLRNTIQNELRFDGKNVWTENPFFKEQKLYAKT